ncbi:MAG: folate-binding protein [Pacificimonas sp.]
MLVHLSDRKVLRLSSEEGMERLSSFLNGLVTGDVAKVTKDAPLWTGLLTAQGKYLSDMIVFAGGAGELLLDLPEARFDETVKALKRYRLRQKIGIDPSEQRVFAAWNEPLVVETDDPRSAALGKRWLAATANVDGDASDYHAHRIAVGVPDSADFIALGEAKLMWLESGADLLDGVDFTKGCFVGQENTARMNYRGKVRKRILPVTLSSDPGAERDMTADGKAAGTLTSVAETKDGWRGMALLKLDMMDGPLAIGDVSAEMFRPDWFAESVAS